MGLGALFGAALISAIVDKLGANTDFWYGTEPSYRICVEKLRIHVGFQVSLKRTRNMSPFANDMS